MPDQNDAPTSTTYGSINLKVTDEEKWAFKEWCVRHRMTQVDAFREAFALLEATYAGEDRT